MANWYGTCRSNYFRVKDDAAFVDFLAPFDVEHITKDVDGVLLHGFIALGEDGSMPQHWGENMDQDEPTTLIDVLAPHLADGEVALAMEVGAEKARYLSGHAWAVSSNGTVEFVDLYITPVEY